VVKIKLSFLSSLFADKELIYLYIIYAMRGQRTNRKEHKRVRWFRYPFLPLSLNFIINNFMITWHWISTHGQIFIIVYKNFMVWVNSHLDSCSVIHYSLRPSYNSIIFMNRFIIQVQVMYQGFDQMCRYNWIQDSTVHI
jgi:hypothetical protein